jgi:hypothetical protein
MGLVHFVSTFLNTTITTPVAEKNIVSLAAIDPITVDFNTDFEDLDLPETVMASFDTGSPELVNLTWVVGDYDGLWDGVVTIYANPIETSTIFNPSDIQAEIDVTVEDIPAPNYALLANIKLILDAQGLVPNSTNSYGTLNSSNQLTNFKSLTPGPTGEDFPSNGTAPDFYNKVIYGNGDGRLRHATLAYFNFMSYNATFANLKWTLHVVAMFEDVHNGVYGLLGSNGSSGSSKGIAVYFANSSANPYALRSMISKLGVPLIIDVTQANAIPKHSLKVLTIVTDCSQAAADRQKFYIDGVQQTYAVVSTSTAVATTPTYGMEIFGAGNGTLPMVGALSHLVITENAALNTPFIDTLIPHTLRPVKYTVDRLKAYALTSFLDENSYYLNVAVEKNPVTGKYLVVFGNWTSAGHLWSETNFAAFRTSNDLLTFTTKATAFSPAGTKGIIDMGFFFDSEGVGHGFANTMDGTGTTSTPGTSELWYFSTVDDGANWTNEEITNIPSDGLAVDAAYGNGYTHNGYNYFTVYRYNADLSASANYILKWELGADISTIEWIEIRAGATYINEGSIAPTGETSHVWIGRHEVTKEWVQIETEDDWATFTSPVDLTFGETLSQAGPVRITQLEIEAVPCLACYYPIRSTSVLKVIYAKKSDFATLHEAAWISGTKIQIVDETENVHYGGVCQYNGNMNGFAVYTREEADATSNLISFPIPTTSYTTIRTALGITLIGT